LVGPDAYAHWRATTLGALTTLGAAFIAVAGTKNRSRHDQLKDILRDGQDSPLRNRPAADYDGGRVKGSAT